MYEDKYSGSHMSRVQSDLTPNLLILTFGSGRSGSLVGKGANFKASLLVGDRSFSEEFGERLELYRAQLRTVILERTQSGATS